MTPTQEKLDSHPLPPSPCAEGTVVELQAECKRLAQLLQQREEELQRQTRLMAMIREERDQYRRILYPPIEEQFTEEELRHFATDDNTEGAKELREFIGEVEDIVHGRKRAS